MVKTLVRAISGGAKTPKFKVPVEAPKPVTPMPDEEDLKRAAMAEQLRQKRTGRSSTLLADDNEDGL